MGAPFPSKIKAILLGIAKGATAAAQATVSTIDSDHNGLDVNAVGGGFQILDLSGNPLLPAQESGGNLASIKTNTDKIPSKGTAVMTGSTPVTLATDDAAIKALTAMSVYRPGVFLWEPIAPTTLLTNSLGHLIYRVPADVTNAYYAVIVHPTSGGNAQWGRICIAAIRTMSGTVTMTSGSTAVTGGTEGADETFFCAEVLDGEYLCNDRSSWAKVLSVLTDHSLTLVDNYTGSTHTGVAEATALATIYTRRQYSTGDEKVYGPLSTGDAICYYADSATPVGTIVEIIRVS